jgi:hypothetical protein
VPSNKVEFWMYPLFPTLAVGVTKSLKKPSTVALKFGLGKVLGGLKESLVVVPEVVHYSFIISFPYSDAWMIGLHCALAMSSAGSMECIVRNWKLCPIKAK